MFRFTDNEPANFAVSIFDRTWTQIVLSESPWLYYICKCGCSAHRVDLRIHCVRCPRMCRGGISSGTRGRHKPGFGSSAQPWKARGKPKIPTWYCHPQTIPPYTRVSGLVFCYPTQQKLQDNPLVMMVTQRLSKGVWARLRARVCARLRDSKALRAVMCESLLLHVWHADARVCVCVCRYRYLYLCVCRYVLIFMFST